MTRKLTPEQAKLSGADKKNPQRYRKKPPKSPFDLGDPPKHLCKEKKAIWAEVVKYSLPGTLTGAERFHMELLVDLFHEFRNPPSYGFTSANRGQLVTLLAKLGLNPIDRQRLGIEPPKKPKGDKPDDFSDL